MAVDSQPKRKTSLEELLTLNVCVLFSKPLRTSFHVHRVSSRSETRGTSSLPLEQKYQQQCDCRIVESWSELGWSWIGLLPWSTIEQHTHTHTHTHRHTQPFCLDGTKHRFSGIWRISRGSTMTWIWSKEKNKVFSIRRCWQTKVLPSMITCSCCVYSNDEYFSACN